MTEFKTAILDMIKEIKESFTEKTYYGLIDLLRNVCEEIKNDDLYWVVYDYCEYVEKNHEEYTHSVQSREALGLKQNEELLRGIVDDVIAYSNAVTEQIENDFDC